MAVGQQGMAILWNNLSSTERHIFETAATHDLMLGAGDSRITTYVDIQRYPRLKIMHQGNWLSIRGVIQSVSEDGMTVRLKDSELSFDDESEKAGR